MSVVFRKITNTKDLQKLVAVFDVVFKKKTNLSEEHLNILLLNYVVFNLGAFIDNVLVGGISAHELSLISGNKEFYIYDIGVLPEYQKMGIGTGLIKELKKEAKIRGISTIFVEAESDDEGAVAFYRSLNEEEVAVKHFNLSVSRDY